MTINYIENGIAMHDAISAAGYELVWQGLPSGGSWQAYQGGQQSAAIDAAVNTIISGFNSMPAYKAAAASFVSSGAVSLCAQYFPGISDFGSLQLVKHIAMSVAGIVPTTQLAYVIAVHDAAATAISSIQAQTTPAGIQSVTPVWPTAVAQTPA